MTRMHNVPPLTPELDKMLAATKKGSQETGEFLEWLLHERGFVLAKYERVKDWHESDRLIHHPITINALLAEYSITAWTGTEQSESACSCFRTSECARE